MFVGFSGGCDSSLVLSAATHVARRDGHADPVPVTLTYGNDSSDDERCAELMVRSLNLDEWIRIDASGRSDMLGPASTASLRELGLLFPATAHPNRSLWGQLSGGTYLTGEAGDEVLGLRRISPLAEVVRYLVRGRRLPTGTVVRRTADALAPRRRRVKRSLEQLDATIAAHALVRPPCRAVARRGGAPQHRRHRRP
jgi:hypothetical protein